MYGSEPWKVDNTICMVLEWTPEEASLLQDRPVSAAASQGKHAWKTQNHQTFSSISLED